MIIQRMFSSKAQKARRKKFDLEMANKAEESVMVPDTMNKPTEADRIRKGRKAIKTGKDDLGMPIERSKRSNLGYGKGAYNVHDSINKAKPGDIKNATSSFGTNPEAKERVAERFGRSGKMTGDLDNVLQAYTKSKKLKRDAKVGKVIESAKKNKGKIALATGGAVAAGYGAKKLYDKEKSKKEEKK